ncbi:MAG: recombinase family protein [Clostridia bacterium]|nr:recombinase family protein [Clostridia bacterium]
MSFVDNIKSENSTSNFRARHNYYKAGSTLIISAYARLSRDEDKENYSSIEEQIRMIKEYAEEKGWYIADKNIYIDDNVSGYTFNRPGFRRMLEDLDEDVIDVVIAKDLSRIGRNNGKVLTLIDDFKKANKNLILVSEMGGVYDVQNDRDDTIGITTWYNERYVKDISRKTRSNMLSKQKTGRLIMGNYYGYEKVFEYGIPKLYVIEELRGAIELIYKLYVEKGLGRKRITDILNSDKYNYPTPSVYYQREHLARGRVYKHKVQELWSTDMVKNILENDVYCGNLRVHKKQTITIRGRVAKLPEEEHFVFENHHEAIISKEMFELAQELKVKRVKNKSTKTKRDYIFGGMCSCGDCGGGVSGTFIRRKEEKGYECTDYRRYGVARCKIHETLEKDILIHLKEYLKLLKVAYEDEIKKIKLYNTANKCKINREKLEKEYNMLNEEYKLLLSQKIKDLVQVTSLEQREMVENAYKDLESSKQNQIISLKETLAKDDEKILEDKERKIKSALDIFDEIISTNEPSKYLLNSIIEKIVIYNDKTIEFILKGDIKKIIQD